MPRDPLTGFPDPDDFGTVHAPLPAGWIAAPVPLVSSPASEPPPAALNPVQALQRASSEAAIQRLLTQDSAGARNQRVASYGQTRIVATSDATADERAAAHYVCDGFADEKEVNNALLEGDVRVVGPNLTTAAAIRVPSGRTLDSQGFGTIITATGAYNVIENEDIGSNETNSDITIRGFTINCADLAEAGINGRFTNSLIEAVTVLNASGSLNIGIGLIGSNTTDVRISRCTVADCSLGIYVQGGALRVTIENNLISGGGDTGIRAAGPALRLSVIGNILTDTGIGITADDSTVSNNNIEGAGIGVTGDDNGISGNRVYNATGTGISISGTYNEVTDNRVRDCGAFGISVGGSSHHNAVNDNKVIQCGKDGSSNIVIQNGGDYNQVFDNEVYRGDSGSMANYGIRIVGSSSNDNVVTGNYFRLGLGGTLANIRDDGTGTRLGPGNDGLHTHASDAQGGQIAAADVTIADAGGDFTATTVEGALDELQADAEADATALTSHLNDTSDAHDASAISILDTAGDFTATDVEGALAELQADAEAHFAAGDPHPGYRLESANHAHTSSGAEGGQIPTSAVTTVEETLSTTGTPINDWAVASTTDVVIWDGAASSTVSSIASPTVGRDLYIHNNNTVASARTLTLLHAAGTGTAANRLKCDNGTDYVINPQGGTHLKYIGTRWVNMGGR